MLERYLKKGRLNDKIIVKSGDPRTEALVCKLSSREIIISIKAFK